MVNRILLYTLIAFQMGCGCFCTGGRRHGNFPTVTFSMNGNVPANFRPHIVQAEGTWTAASLGSIQILNGPATGNPGFNVDGQNVIDFFFVPIPLVLAGTLVMDATLFGCWIQEVDIVFNSNLAAVGIPGAWDTSGVPGANRYDVQTVALHELGHTLELLHVDCPSNSIMLPSYNQLSHN
ncbi:MAG: matrixin family metalloprotease, partial [Blastocatellia bacterium]